MSAAVGAALKKIAAALLTNPKVLKTVLGIVLGIVIVIITPIVAVIAVFNGGIKLDTEKLQQMITENLSAADQAMLQQVEDTMYAIENEMTAAGFTGRIKEAQVLYILALEDYAEETDFVSKLVGCFTVEQTDEQLIAAVNAAFGTELTAEEFWEVMGDIRSTAVDTSDWTDKAVKNNLDLVRWAQLRQITAGGMCTEPMEQCWMKNCWQARSPSIRTRPAAMRHSSGRTGWESARLTV